MKRRFMPLFLCIALIMSGCAQTPDEFSAAEDNLQTAESSVNAESMESAENGKTADSADADAADNAPSAESADEELTLMSASLAQLSDASFAFENDFLSGYMGNKSDRLGDYRFSRDSERDLSVTGTLNVRESTRKIALNDEEKASFRSEVSASEYITFDEAEEKSAYDCFKKKRESFDIEKVNVRGEEVALNVSNAQFGYTLDRIITLNAFAARNEDGSITFIPDPAYMYGIPVIAKNPEHLTFDINGKEVMMDSFAVTGEECRAADFPEVFGERGTEYFYAKVQFGGLDVNYDFASGYQCGANIYKITLITDDVEGALSKTFTMDDAPDKDPAMTEVYNAIMDNLDTFYKETTHGVTLLDLDFDGTPELLVSDVAERDTREYAKLGADVSVYRIENGGLKYIDTFPSAHIVVYNIYNSLGLKTLPDGTKGWFSTSYYGEDFVYRLVDDKLEKTDILTKELKSATALDDYGNFSYEYDYYFMGELIVPTVIHEDITGQEGEMSDTHFEWNGSYSYFGVMWELIGKIREDYCADITETHGLYSEWLSPYAHINGWSPGIAERYSLTDRELSYNIAYLVDSYYLGDYSAESCSYEYRFLGDYAKPVIYLYPERETEVSVKIDLPEDGELTCTYPDYGNGWDVTALPDGTLYDRDGNEYYCLYWEGSGSALLEGGRGWCVAGDASAEFLREKLTEIGLTAREANEFIIYWLPELQKSAYNVITFHTEDYARGIPLTVSPAPDSVIRVFMTFEPSDGLVDIAPQNLPHYERNGFTLVEWGGSRQQDGSRLQGGSRVE